MLKRGAFLLVAILAQTALSQQYVLPNRLAEGSFVADQVGVLSEDHAQEINAIGSEVKVQKGFPIVVVVIQSLDSMYSGDLTIEQYSRMLFDSWGIGTQNLNKGMLLVVSIDDREARIELGSDWGGKANDDTDAVMANMIVPRFKSDDYSGGLLAGARGLKRIAEGETDFAGQVATKPWINTNIGDYLPAFFFGVIFVLALISRLFNWSGPSYRRRRRGYWDYDDDEYYWNDNYNDNNSSWGGWGGGGGGGFSGGGSFGGGSGGGGGSTGSW